MWSRGTLTLLAHESTMYCRESLNWPWRSMRTEYPQISDILSYLHLSIPSEPTTWNCNNDGFCLCFQTDDDPCNENLCNLYTTYSSNDTATCRAERNGSTCTARMYDLTRECIGNGIVPAGCLSSADVCGSDARPGGNVMCYHSVDLRVRRQTV